MKRTVMLAALFLATAAALANDVDPMSLEKEHRQFSKSRAEVVADRKAAQAAGQLPIGQLGVKPVETQTARSRAEVKAETREAGRRGQLSGHGELGPTPAGAAKAARS